jgi:very-short-patch-repair endonuclease
MGYFCYSEGMETYIILGLVFLAAILVARLTAYSSSKKKVFKNNLYSYAAKSSLMSRTESDFFIKLERVVSERYYVFPQVHLSAILDHRVKGQEWKYAFSHINGKSVDYVLCSRTTLKPTYAIELDDATHDQKDRRQRDREVERIFEAANLPLVRFRNKDVSDGEILQALVTANDAASVRSAS